MRDLQQAARRLVKADTEELESILRYDPDMIRDVARAAIRPIWIPHDPDCSVMDNEFGPCSCGSYRASEMEARQAKEQTP